MRRHIDRPRFAARRTLLKYAARPNRKIGLHSKHFGQRREVRDCSTRQRAVRSGSDIAKALALGATAVGVGRPYIYALALGAADGVVSQLRALLAELDLLMAVDGFPSIADLRAAGAQRI